MIAEERWYLALSLKAPFGGVFVQRQMTSRIVVGGAWQDPRSLQVVLDDMKTHLIAEHGAAWRSVVQGPDWRGLIEDVDDRAARGLERIIQGAVDMGWQQVYQPVDVCRQALETIIVAHAATSKLEIDAGKPGAKMLDSAIKQATVGGCYDALALVAFQIGEDFPAGRGNESYRVVNNLDYLNERDRALDRRDD